MTELFEPEAKTKEQIRSENTIDWYNAFAREKLGMPDRWRWFRVEVKNHGKPSAFISLTGAVCDAKKTSGKYKGSDNWKLRDKSTEAELAIRMTELEAFQHDWQIRTGKCKTCQGTGEVVQSWSATDGVKYRACSKCAGSGSPQLSSNKWGTE